MKYLFLPLACSTPSLSYAILFIEISRHPAASGYIPRSLASPYFHYLSHFNSLPS